MQNFLDSTLAIRARETMSGFLQYRKITLLFMAILLCSMAIGCESGQEPRSSSNKFIISANAIDINGASAAELEALPGIGETLAKRIVEFREKNGRFRRPENLLLVPGMSDSKFRRMRNLVKAQ
jgi:competence ComEA-like helix-hairpin-helix protein